MGVTHFSGPLLYSGKPAARGWQLDMPIGLDTDYVQFMDDFTGIVIDATNDWTVVKDTGASVALSADTVNGWVKLSSAATTDDDGSSIQGNEIFKPLAARDIWFETVIQSTDSGSAVDEQDICVGLTINFATNPEAMLTAADRIVFQINDGDASILCKTEFSGTETSTDSQIDIADATDIILGFHVKGTTAVEFFVNRNLVATHTANIVTDQELTIGAMQLSGSASGTKSVIIDYLSCTQTR
jgi:hypothetical protein